MRSFGRLYCQQLIVESIVRVHLHLFHPFSHSRCNHLISSTSLSPNSPPPSHINLCKPQPVTHACATTLNPAGTSVDNGSSFPRPNHVLWPCSGQVQGDSIPFSPQTIDRTRSQDRQTLQMDANHSPTDKSPKDGASLRPACTECQRRKQKVTSAPSSPSSLILSLSSIPCPCPTNPTPPLLHPQAIPIFFGGQCSFET